MMEFLVYIRYRQKRPSESGTQSIRFSYTDLVNEIYTIEEINVSHLFGNPPTPFISDTATNWTIQMNTDGNQTNLWPDDIANMLASSVTYLIPTWIKELQLK